MESSIILKVMLSSKDGYNILENYDLIKPIVELELVFDALKISANIRAINPKYSDLIIEKGATVDPYNFLNLYLSTNSLDNVLELNNNTSIEI